MLGYTILNAPNGERGGAIPNSMPEMIEALIADGWTVQEPQQRYDELPALRAKVKQLQGILRNRGT